MSCFSEMLPNVYSVDYFDTLKAFGDMPPETDFSSLNEIERPFMSVVLCLFEGKDKCDSKLPSAQLDL